MAATEASKASARKGVRVRLPPPAPFLDSLRRAPVTWTVSWGCSSAGRAQGWQSWGQGFEPPQLHQKSTRGYGTIRNPALRFGGRAVTLAEASTTLAPG